MFYESSLLARKSLSFLERDGVGLYVSPHPRFVGFRLTRIVDLFEIYVTLMGSVTPERFLFWFSDPLSAADP